MKRGNKVIILENNKQGYIQVINNDRITVSIASERRNTPDHQSCTAEEIRICDLQVPVIGDHTAFGTVSSTRYILASRDMIEATFESSDASDTRLWVTDEIHKAFSKHLESKNQKALYQANWISSDHLTRFLAFYGIEKSGTGEYCWGSLSHNPRPLNNSVLSVKYEDGAVEELRVDLNDEGNIRSVSGGDQGSLSTLFDFRMAGIVEATLISKHSLTDFPPNEEA